MLSEGPHDLPFGHRRTSVIEAYLKHEAERKELGIPAKPLDPEQTRELVKLLQKPPKGKEQFLGKVEKFLAK